MTKEVEVGDSFQGKVVKTTTFGAFVELAKGTDGLLHISNVSPGQRVDTVEDVLNKGDEIAVRVVEVDRERGRIGLRLAEDPEIAGKSVEELAGVGSGGGGGGGGGPRAAAATATAAAAAAAATAAAATADRAAPARRPGPRARTSALPDHRHHRARLRTAGRDGAHELRPVRGPRLLRRHGLARRDRRRVRPLALPRAPAVPRHGPLRLGGDRPAVRRRWAPSSTPAPTRRPPRSTRGCSTSTCRAPST